MTTYTAVETPAQDAPKPARGAGRWLMLAGAALLVLVTLYMGTMTVLWGIQMNSLKSTRSELKAELASEQARVDALEAANTEAADAASAARLTISELADDKADAQDYQDLYSNVSLSLVACARERDDQIDIVKNRARYTPDSVAKYEDSIDKFCNKASKALGELIDDEGEE